MLTVVPYIYSHTLCEHVHIPATSIPQKKTSRKKPTIYTRPTKVPTTTPAMTPGDKPGRAVGREIERDTSVLVLFNLHEDCLILSL